MTTIEVKRWRVFCTTDNKLVDGYLDRDSGEPTTCFDNNTHTIDSVRTQLIEVIANKYTKSVIKWSTHCDTENITVTGFLNSDSGPPSVCFNDNTHTVSNVNQVEVINNLQVEVTEKSTNVQGYFRAESIKLSLSPYETLVYDKTWTNDISPLSVNMLATDNHAGDSMLVDMAPNKQVGVITQDIAVSDTTLSVTGAALTFIKIGFYIRVSDGVNTNELGMVTGIDHNNNTITVETPATDVFLASSPSILDMSVRFLGPYEFGFSGNVLVGATKLGASFVPSQEIVRMTYTNNSPSYKELYIVVEYLY